jgi:hypothetical protein
VGARGLRLALTRGEPQELEVGSVGNQPRAAHTNPHLWKIETNRVCVVLLSIASVILLLGSLGAVSWLVW